jgi:threonine aldolase
MSDFNRRQFLRFSGLATLPFLGNASTAFSQGTPAAEMPLEVIKFFGDGEMFEPAEYLAVLQQLNAQAAIQKDRYGSGGAVEALEKKMAEITGKEKAIYMPSGTMANQLAISVLSGDQTKVFVQDTSHVYRDEADAAQSVFQKRLYPLAKEETYFTAATLQTAIEQLPEQEVFGSGIGAVSIENPVRRTDGRMIPIGEIKKISEYCSSKGIKLHLDGARIYMASAWSGISIKEFSSYFDTVYISLYKYLGASGGAVLCGDKDTISKMPHLVKVHGGSMYGNWTNAAMALGRLEGLEDRLLKAKAKGEELFAQLNKRNDIRINPLDGGTNIYQLELTGGTDARVFQQTLNKEFSIRLPFAPGKTKTLITVNETILYKDLAYILNAFSQSLKAGKSG